jgi:hypothetical protein
MMMRAPEDSTRAISDQLLQSDRQVADARHRIDVDPEPLSCSPASRAMRRHCTMPKRLVG